MDTPVTTEDFGATLFRMGRARGAMTASQVSAGRKNGLVLEIYGTKGGASWRQESPDELWLGHRNDPNQLLLKDPSLLTEKARGFADYPGGHAEGYPDTHKQLFRRFYASIADPSLTPDYPADGRRPPAAENPGRGTSQPQGPCLGGRAKSGLKPDHQSSRINEMEWCGITVLTVTAPSRAVSQRGDSRSCSPSLSFSSAICSALGFWGEPIAFHTV